MANDLNINWKDGVGEVTDQPLTVSPGSGTGDAAVSFGSVMNKGLDRTLELEITTPKGVKKTLTVNQEGCRQAYITSDGKRWLTSDNRVYGVLKSNAPCACMDKGIISYVKPDGGVTDIPSLDCIGIVLDDQGKKFMIEKNETSNESYKNSWSDGNNKYFYWGGNGIDQAGITSYINVDGSNESGCLRSESCKYYQNPKLSPDINLWTSGALSDWEGKSNSEVLKGVIDSGILQVYYPTMGYLLNTFLASPDAKGFDDWYIPSLPQLALIWMNLTSVNNALSAIGGEQLDANGRYWSSSENSSGYGWRIYTDSGIASRAYKGDAYSVRLIRDI